MYGTWDRTANGWQHALVAAALALPAVSDLTAAGGQVGAIALRLGLVGLLGLWYGYWFILRAGGLVHRAYLIGAAALWAVMSALDPALLAVGAAMIVPYCLRRVFLAAALFAVIAAGWLGQRLLAGKAPSGTGVLACLLGVATAIAVAGYIATLYREGHRRQRLLDDLAAAHAELAAAERWTGVLTERQRLARDIHDTLTQGFASIALHLDAARDDLPPGPATQRVHTALRTARENLVESRRLVNALRPAQLDGDRLPHAIRLLTGRLSAETGLVARSVITGSPLVLPEAVETQLLRVIQEALTNVRRHAMASEVVVTLSYVDDVMTIDVQDDGTGFTDPSRAGVGLATMRERIDSLGGTFTVESTPGEGTTIALSVPVVT